MPAVYIHFENNVNMEFFLLHTVLITQTLDFKKEISAELDSVLLKHHPDPVRVYIFHSLFIYTVLQNLRT